MLALRPYWHPPDVLFNLLLFFFNDPATPEISTLSLHDALPISSSLVRSRRSQGRRRCRADTTTALRRSEEHTSELQSRGHLVCRLLLEKKKKNKKIEDNLKRKKRDR